MTSYPLAQPTTILFSDSPELLGTFRKVLCVARSEEAGGQDLYSVLYPPGWCLLDQLEESHRLCEDQQLSCSGFFIPVASGEKWASLSSLGVLDRYCTVLYWTGQVLNIIDKNPQFYKIANL